VLVGDFLYSRAFQMMVGVGSMRVMQVLADATNIIAEGEVLQLMNCHNAAIDVEDYLRVVRYKTAKLFEAAARLGAILGDSTPAIEAGLADYGMHLGTAFQIVDDVLDYSGEEGEIGKHLGDDLAEGKPTLPLIHVMRHGQPAQSELVKNALEQGGRAAFPEIIKAVQATGALDVAMGVARGETERAKQALTALPDTQYREALIQLSEFAITRRH
jgi:octaprenyl-diphosphate synthase